MGERDGKIRPEDREKRFGGISKVSINGDTDGQVCFVLREEGLKQIGESDMDNPVLFLYTLRKDL